MRGTFLNGLHHGTLFIGLIFLFIFPSETHVQSEGYTLKLNPEVHLNSLFAKYKVGDTICDEDLDRLISDTRNPVEKCFDAKNIVNGSLDKEALRAILPTLIFGLVEQDCQLNLLKANPKYASQNWKVWVASIIAVIIISFSGLLVVALVSKMSRKIYNVVTQFLIALSVGSLIGDTFLHLIPHALLSDGSNSHGHSHESNGKDGNLHDTFIWKAMIVILGIYAFFLTERITIIGQNHASMRKLKRNEKLKSLSPNNLENGKESLANSVAALTRQSSGLTSSPSQGASNEPFVDLNQRTPGENPCTNRIGVDEITCELDEGPPSGTRHLCNRPPSRPLDNARCSEFLANEQGTNINGVASNSISLNLEDSEEEESKRHVKFEGDYLNNDDGSRSESGDDDDDDYTEVNKKADKAVQESHAHHTHGHGHHHHGHGHGHRHHSHHHGHSRRGPLHPSKPHGHHHGHSHDLSSVKAIAWTIVAGDGLHNFCDGIAIGASFAVDINGGISTALAVLCHELPHELGDFAVLLHAGMSAKTALFYNTLSSILCATGMVLGVLLGSMPTVNLWLFLLTAGMFVYIALVDMMPELTTSRMHGYRTCHLPTVLFFWQNVGMVIGVVIMLLIAKFEKHMPNTF